MPGKEVQRLYLLRGRQQGPEQAIITSKYFISSGCDDCRAADISARW